MEDAAPVITSGLTALATLVLALVAVLQIKASRRQVDTSREAVEATRRAAEAAEHQVEVAAKALHATTEALLVDVPRDYPVSRSRLTFHTSEFRDIESAAVVTHLTEGDVEGDLRLYVSVPLRNVGPGVAFIRGLSLQYEGGSASGAMTRSVVPSRETTRVTFTVHRNQADMVPERFDAITRGAADVVVRYTDASGTVDRRTRLSLGLNARQEVAVRQVFLYRADEEDPYAASGPAEE